MIQYFEGVSFLLVGYIPRIWVICYSELIGNNIELWVKTSNIEFDIIDSFNYVYRSLFSSFID